MEEEINKERKNCNGVMKHKQEGRKQGQGYEVSIHH